MSEEEKKAIKYYESEIDLAKRLDEVIVNGRIEPLEKIINLTKKQQKEIEKNKNFIDFLQLNDVKKLGETIKKDKQIDLMIKELKKQFRRSEPCDLDFEVECKKYKTCEECIKNYFEGKVEEE